MTLVVNLFAGPGVGKSTAAAGVFYHLKQMGHNIEMAPEFAKDLTWEKRSKTILFQPYVAAKQIWRITRLLGQVEAIITDSPILLSAVYKGEGYTDAFESYLHDTFQRWDTENFFLTRNPLRTYNTKGRRQTEEEARKVDMQIAMMLDRFSVPGEHLTMSEATVSRIVDKVDLRLRHAL
jgi:hypothetical protein